MSQEKQKKFWTKCNKILTKNGLFQICQDPPCPYYTLIGFKYRQVNCETELPLSECGWSYDVQACKVIDNRIQWYKFDNICVPISRNRGECVHKIIKMGPYQQCIETDPITQECIRYETKYTNCIQVYGYNFLTCFEDAQLFRVFFFTMCSYQQIPTPYIWTTDFWTTKQCMTDEAKTCISNFWNKVFADKYLLNYKLKYISQSQSWHIQMVSQQKNDRYEVGYKATNYSLIEGGGFPMSAYYFGADKPVGDGKGTCCVTNQARQSDAVLNTGNFIMGHINNTNSYTSGTLYNFTCTNSQNICLNFNYTSELTQNWSGRHDETGWSINWYNIELLSSNLTPSGATGIEFLAKIKRTKSNVGYGRQDQQIFQSQTSFTLNFGQTYNSLPIANNVNMMSYLSYPSCTSACLNLSGEVHNQPYQDWTIQQIPYQNDVLKDKIEVTIKGIKYI